MEEQLNPQRVAYNKDMKIVSDEHHEAVCRIIHDDDTSKLVFSVKKDPVTGWLLDCHEDRYGTEYVRVTKNVFDNYVSYLKSRNKIWLAQCEKEMVV